MGLEFFIKGAIVGFSIAAPVGPIGALCIRRTFAFGRLSGLFSGMGAAVADAIFGIILVSGLTLISDYLLKGQFWLHLIGGGFLLYLGLKTFKAKPGDLTKKVTHKTLFRDFLSTFFLTLTNPLTIISYLAVFTGLGLADLRGDWLNAFFLVLGVFAGATFWWFLLSEAVSLFRKRINQKSMVWVNRVTGVIIAGFGLLAWLYMIF